MNLAASLSQNILQGLQVLIVEDETLVAMLIEDYLRELGCEIALSASRVAKAMKSTVRGALARVGPAASCFRSRFLKLT